MPLTASPAPTTPGEQEARHAQRLDNPLLDGRERQRAAKAETIEQRRRGYASARCRTGPTPALTIMAIDQPDDQRRDHERRSPGSLVCGRWRRSSPVLIGAAEGTTGVSTGSSSCPFVRRIIAVEHRSVVRSRIDLGAARRLRVHRGGDIQRPVRSANRAARPRRTGPVSLSRTSAATPASRKARASRYASSSGVSPCAGHIRAPVAEHHEDRLLLRYAPGSRAPPAPDAGHPPRGVRPPVGNARSRCSARAVLRVGGRTSSACAPRKAIKPTWSRR